jgi:hypothetical protein
MRQIKKTKESVVLNVNGKVIQDAESCLQRIELEEESEIVEILRQRLASRGRMRGRPAEDFSMNSSPGIILQAKILVPEGPHVYSYQIMNCSGLRRSPMLRHHMALLWSAKIPLVS